MKLNHTEEEIRALADGATRGPLRLARYEEFDNNGVTAAEHVAENLSHGSGPVWGVMAPEHPLTVGGWDARPEHAVVTCITGNGPTSERNAAFYAAAPTIAADALAMHAEIARLRAEVASLRVTLGGRPAPDETMYRCERCRDSGCIASVDGEAMECPFCEDSP